MATATNISNMKTPFIMRRLLLVILDSCCLLCISLLVQATFASPIVSIRRASRSDQAAIAALVMDNHLQLSRSDPAEYIAQVRDLPHDFGHLLDPATFAKGHYWVATADDDTTHPTNTDTINQSHQPNSFNDDQVSSKSHHIVASAGMIPSIYKQKEGITEDSASINRITQVELTAVSVSATHRRQGLARQLVTRVLDEIPQRYPDCQRVVLVTLRERMAAACRLYESLGFRLVREEKVHDDPTEEGNSFTMTVRYYELKLTPSNRDDDTFCIVLSCKPSQS